MYYLVSTIQPILSRLTIYLTIYPSIYTCIMVLSLSFIPTCFILPLLQFLFKSLWSNPPKIRRQLKFTTFHVTHLSTNYRLKVDTTQLMLYHRQLAHNCINSMSMLVNPIIPYSSPLYIVDISSKYS